MRVPTVTVVLALSGLLTTVPARAGDKLKGSAPLKDVQTAGMKDKNNKHQAYDLFFEAQNRSYTCRTDSGKSMNATDFVVGTTMRYEIDGDKAKLWSPENKKVECKIARVEALSRPM